MDNDFKQLANPKVPHCSCLEYVLRDKTFLILSHKSYVGRRMQSFCYLGNVQINNEIIAMIRFQVPIVFRRRKGFPPFTLDGLKERNSRLVVLPITLTVSQYSPRANESESNCHHRSACAEPLVATPQALIALEGLRVSRTGTAHVRRGQGGARYRRDVACPAHRCRFQSAEADGFGFAELPMLPKPVSRIL